MSNEKEPIVFTPGLGDGVKVRAKVTDLPAAAPEFSQELGGDLEQQQPAGLNVPPYIRAAIESDLGQALGVAVVKELLGNFADMVTAVFGLDPARVSAILREVADEFGK